VRRETRLNLIFLVAFLAISLPGAVILFHKKLDPRARRMDQPDVMTDRLPYMTPLPVPPGVKWVVPDRTRAWLEELAKTKMGGLELLSASPAGPRWMPIISQDHLVQVMTAIEMPVSTRIGLLIWDASIEPSPGRFAVTVDAAPARVTGINGVSVPQDVRGELVSLGLTKPPRVVYWLDVESAPLRSAPARLTLDYDGPPASLHTSVEFAIK